MSAIFESWDLVHIAKDLGQSMSHFTADADAIVRYSYGERYGRGRTVENDSYCLHIKDRGESSWYYANQLTLIAKNQQNLLQQWQDEADRKARQESDLDWIFANGPSLLRSASGSSVQALAKGLGCHDLWGLSGEGMTYYANSQFTMDHAAPFLKFGDKVGWLKHCADYIAEHGERGPKPYPRPREGIQAAIDLYQMTLDGDNRHPLTAAKEIGLEWTDAEAQPIADQWMLYGIKSLPAEVPKWLRVIQP